MNFSDFSIQMESNSRFQIIASLQFLRQKSESKLTNEKLNHQMHQIFKNNIILFIKIVFGMCVHF